jgi:hypothetical protein
MRIHPPVSPLRKGGTKDGSAWFVSPPCEGGVRGVLRDRASSVRHATVTRSIYLQSECRPTPFDGPPSTSPAQSGSGALGPAGNLRVPVSPGWDRARFPRISAPDRATVIPVNILVELMNRSDLEPATGSSIS